MSRVLITGSSTGLGFMAGQLLVEQGHKVILHARDQTRADDTCRALPQASAVIIGDLSSIAGARVIAEQANRLGIFDAVIHNAGVGFRERDRTTEEGLPSVFMVNTLAPYILTALIDRPKRLVYLSSGMHRSARAHLDDLVWQKRAWNGATAYAESKLHDVLLAFAIARHWPPAFIRRRADLMHRGGPSNVPTIQFAHGQRPGSISDFVGQASVDRVVTGVPFDHERPREPPRHRLYRCRGQCHVRPLAKGSLLDLAQCSYYVLASPNGRDPD